MPAGDDLELYLLAQKLHQPLVKVGPNLPISLTNDQDISLKIPIDRYIFSFHTCLLCHQIIV